MPERPTWHGEHEVPTGSMVRIAIGPLALAVAHRPGEWRIGWHANGEARGEARASVGAAEPIEDLGPAFTVQRFLTRRTADAVRLLPRLADRPVVTRPELPVMVPAGDEADIYVSTPVWVRIELPAPERVLLEVPVSRPSDTWFGPDTRRGEVAYASQTSARLELVNLPPLPHRAITRVTVRNQADSVLGLERLSVPAPSLPLFADRDGFLWTAPLAAVRDSSETPARVEIDAEPPREAIGAELVAEPRDAGGRNVLSRALQVLVG